jgi:hypothetical protein
MATDIARIGEGVDAPSVTIDGFESLYISEVELDEWRGGYVFKFSGHANGSSGPPTRAVVVDLSGSVASWLVEKLGRRLERHDEDAVEDGD